jgi:hypothetical protein
VKLRAACAAVQLLAIYTAAQLRAVLYTAA